MKPSAALLALFGFLVTAPALAQTASGTFPTTVSIRLDKEEVLPGEVLDVTLTGFRDATGQSSASRYRIVVGVLEGEILDGEPLADPDMERFLRVGTEPPKAFFVGDGTLEIRYRAPVPCPVRSGKPIDDSLMVWDSPTLGSSDAVPLALTATDKLIASRKIQLLCPSYALIGYHDSFEQRVPNYSTSTTDIRLTLRVDFASFEGGKGAPDLLNVTGVDVIQFEGTSRYETRDGREEMRLVRAGASSYNSVAQLQYDKVAGKILAVALPVIPMRLVWAGEAGFNPPDSIDVGPVTEQDEGAEKDIEEEARKLEQMLDSGNRDMGQMYKALSGFMGAVIHPDNKVKQGDGKTYCAGGGEVVEMIEDGLIRKSYKWELFLED